MIMGDNIVSAIRKLYQSRILVFKEERIIISGSDRHSK